MPIIVGKFAIDFYSVNFYTPFAMYPQFCQRL